MFLWGRNWIFISLFDQLLDLKSWKTFFAKTNYFYCSAFLCVQNLHRFHPNDSVSFSPKKRHNATALLRLFFCSCYPRNSWCLLAFLLLKQSKWKAELIELVMCILYFMVLGPGVFCLCIHRQSSNFCVLCLLDDSVVKRISHLSYLFLSLFACDSTYTPATLCFMSIISSFTFYVLASYFTAVCIPNIFPLLEFLSSPGGSSDNGQESTMFYND